MGPRALSAAAAVAPGYTVRPARADDAPAVAGLWLACDLHDFGTPAADEQEVHEEWDHPGFDLERDTWLVLDPEGGMAAYAQVSDHGDALEAFALVHPEQRGRGLGAAALAFTERRATAGRPAGVALRHITTGVDERAKDLLLKAGYSPIRHFWHMEGELSLPYPDPPAPPDGFDVRTFVPGEDGPILYRIVEASFARHWGWVAEPYDSWKRRLDRPTFDPSLTFFATHGLQEIGALIADERIGMGWVTTLGVLEEWRGRGLGELLLRHAFAAFARRGWTRTGLSVDSSNETGATRLYERVGMRVVRQFDAYRRVLEPIRP